MYDDLGGEVLYMFFFTFNDLMAYFEYCTLVYIYIQLHTYYYIWVHK